MPVIATVVLALVPDATPDHVAALRRAVDTWQHAVHKRIDMPPLLYGPGYCGESTIACVDNGAVIVDQMTSEDQYSIMLHEVGHVIGVPHIEGDAVMEEQYSGPVTGLTELDVVLGRWAVRR